MILDIYIHTKLNRNPCRENTRLLQTVAFITKLLVWSYIILLQWGLVFSLNFSSFRSNVPKTSSPDRAIIFERNWITNVTYILLELSYFANELERSPSNPRLTIRFFHCPLFIRFWNDHSFQFPQKYSFSRFINWY